MNGPKDPAAFPLFGTSHLAALAVLAVLTIWGIRLLSRKDPKVLRYRIHSWLAAVLAVRYIIWLLPESLNGTLTLTDDLPLHLCRVNQILLIYYLLRPNQKLFDILFYWVLAGSSLALIFPEFEGDPLSIAYFGMFLGHGLTLFVMIYLLAVQHLTPTQGSLHRAFIALNLLAFGIVLPIDFLTGGNYLYMMDVPSLDFGPILWLPPHPWYLIILDGFFLLLFWGLYRPFRAREEAGSYKTV